MTTTQRESTPVTADTFDVVNPGTGAVVGSYPIHTSGDIAELLDQAREAQVWWAAQGFGGRQRIMTRWVRWLAAHAEEIYALGNSETARPIGDVQMEFIAGLEDIRWTAANAERVLRRRKVAPGIAFTNFAADVVHEPLGVVGIITPWNVPIYTVLSGAACALAAGNTVIVKPSELSAGAGAFVIDGFHKANPDAPAGVLSYVHGLGETGAALCKSGVDKLAFTGSVPTGRRVMAACAENLTPVVLELGGKDATIIAEDADLEAASTAVVWGAFFNGGQACVGVERVYVVRAVRDEFLELVRTKAEKVTAGLDDGVSYGPMITPGQVEIVRRHIDAAVAGGATALVGGPESVKPPFVHPVVLVDVPEDNPAVCEETFGPVVVINTATDVDDAIRQANSTSFGLGASVFSRKRGAEIAGRMRAGGVTVNAVLSFVGMPSVPFGGVGDSGFGRFHGDAGLREFTYAKSTVRKKFSMGPNVQEFPRTAEHYDVIRKTIRMRYERKFRG
ncbi:aldehyde dehydrogenase family protein [Aeromicrobium panaciterrae]|uniref:aldehyde dehydrogenase family protein n=1 Tax=Aeromicrobium panaciterrae TaxID=363861 RepID=UPI0031E20CCB